jgi:hypothetical protein
MKHSRKRQQRGANGQGQMKRYEIGADRWISPTGNMGHAIVEGDGGPGWLWFEWEMQPTEEDDQFYWTHVHPTLCEFARLVNELSMAKSGASVQRQTKQSQGMESIKSILKSITEGGL